MDSRKLYFLGFFVGVAAIPTNLASRTSQHVNVPHTAHGQSKRSPPVFSPVLFVVGVLTGDLFGVAAVEQLLVNSQRGFVSQNPLVVRI